MTSIKIPAGSIEKNEDATHQAETPKVGDKVELSIEGKITAISGGQAEISVDFINGEPPDQPESPDEKEPSEEDLYKMAEEADANAQQ